MWSQSPSTTPTTVLQLSPFRVISRSQARAGKASWASRPCTASAGDCDGRRSRIPGASYWACGERRISGQAPLDPGSSGCAASFQLWLPRTHTAFRVFFPPMISLQWGRAFTGRGRGAPEATQLTSLASSARLSGFSSGHRAREPQPPLVLGDWTMGVSWALRATGDSGSLNTTAKETSEVLQGTGEPGEQPGPSSHGHLAWVGLGLDPRPLQAGAEGRAHMTPTVTCQAPLF